MPCAVMLMHIHLFNFSRYHSVTLNTLDSPCNNPDSIPGLGSASGIYIWVYYPCSSATSSAREVKQESVDASLCTDVKEPV